MNRTKYIIRLANQLKNKYETDNPFELSDMLGINIYYKDMGSLKGMYLFVNNTRTMCINAGLKSYIKKLVCFHEIGHDLLHRDYLKDGFCFQEFQIYNMQTKMEYEANVFASEFLLPTDKLIEYAKQGFDIHQIAKDTYMDYNLVALKIATLIEAGYKFNRFDFKSDFLK